MKHTVSIILWLLTVLPVLAADFQFHHLDTSRGLPNQQVEAIVQDQDGYIWIGTRNGLARYDGYSVDHYYHHASQAHSLVHNFVHGLFIDSRHRLWVSTENGMSRYQTESDDFRNYHNVRGYCTSFVETSDGRILTGDDQLYAYDEQLDSFLTLPSPGYGEIVSLAKDKSGNIYVATSQDICLLNAELTKILPLGFKVQDDAAKGHNVIMPLFVDSRQRLWIGQNDGGVRLVDLQTKESTLLSASELTGGIVRTITEDGQHRIWLGTENGLLTIYPDGRMVHTVKKYDSDGLSDNAIYCILADRDDNIWIGSYFGGVDYTVRQGSLFQHFQPTAADGGLKARIPRTIIESEPGIFWIATEDNGIHIYDSHTGRFTPFGGISGLDTNVHSIYYDRDHREVWIGSRFKGLYRYNLLTGRTVRYNHSRGVTSEGIFYIMRDGDGKLWIATMDGLRWYDEAADIFRTIGHTMLDHAFVYSLFADRHHALWATTANEGLFAIHDGKVTNFSTHTGCGLKDNYVITVTEDSKGRLWIGTNNNGLCWLDRTTGTIYQAGDWVPQQCTVCSIIEDRNGCLWIGTDRGLYRHDLEDGRTQCFSAGTELPVNQFNFTSACLASDGHVIMGTFDGLISFLPVKERRDARQLCVRFKRLYVNNQVQTVADSTGSIRLSYEDSHSFHIEYGVVMPGGAEGVQYQIRVDGIDRAWRDVGSERSFYGYLLQPGTYYLHVRANQGGADWEACPEQVLKIEIETPFYRTPLAYTLYLLVFLALLVGAFLLYRMRVREQAEIRIANAERENLKEIDKMKTNFFTIVSHELKTPLALIMAPLKSISKATLDTEVAGSLDIAVRNCTKMEHLINELVTFNKIESDNFPFYVQQGNPVTFIATMTQFFHDAVASREQHLVVNCLDNGDEGWFSPSYLEHILGNLMSNAMKFTDKGGIITIGAEIEQTSASTDIYLKIQVTDTGIGIAKDELQNIFGRYYQTKRGYNVNSSGWGIGLALVHRLAEIHKGRVTVESELGKGSTFTVLVNISGSAYSEKDKLPPERELVTVADYLNTRAKEAQNATTDTKNAGGSKASQAGRSGDTLLIVEDNADMLSFLAQLFSEDYHVVTAADGVQAWDICCSRQDIDLVISDIMMPRMGGLELCHLMKGSMGTSHIPLILLTAKGNAEDVKVGYQTGADAYVPKPFDPETLLLQTANLLRLLRNRQERIVEEGEGAIDANDTMTPIDRDFIHRIVTLVDQNIGNADFSVTDITVQLAVSRSLLHTKMKSLMNISAGDYIRHVRIKKACSMLAEGYNVSETAYACGFSDPNYFSKAFKKQTGIPPGEYRSQSA